MQLTGFVKKQGKLYSAICLDLDVASQGKTAKEARAMVRGSFGRFFSGIGVTVNF